MTGGSTTSPAEWKRYREMGAIARVMLVQAAATKWGVEAATLPCRKGSRSFTLLLAQARNLWLAGRCRRDINSARKCPAQKPQRISRSLANPRAASTLPPK